MGLVDLTLHADHHHAIVEAVEDEDDPAIIRDTANEAMGRTNETTKAELCLCLCISTIQ